MKVIFVVLCRHTHIYFEKVKFIKSQESWHRQQTQTIKKCLQLLGVSENMFTFDSLPAMELQT